MRIKLFCMIPLNLIEEPLRHALNDTCMLWGYNCILYFSLLANYKMSHLYNLCYKKVCLWFMCVNRYDLLYKIGVNLHYGYTLIAVYSSIYLSLTVCSFSNTIYWFTLFSIWLCICVMLGTLRSHRFHTLLGYFGYLPNF